MAKFYTALFLLAVPGAVKALLPLRPPCAPLSIVSPYQSLWSCSDNLYDSWPVFWNGVTNGALGLIKVDGSVYRWMGPAVQNRTACTQTRLEVFATTTAYQFDVGASGVQLAVNFTTPAFGLDDDAATHHDWPVTYVHFQALAADCQAHDVEVYLDTTAESVVSDNAHEVAWARTGAANLPSSLAADLFIGTTAQAFGSSTADRVDWGYSHLAVATPAEGGGPVASAMASADTLRRAFCDPNNPQGLASVADDASGPRAAHTNWPALAVQLDLSLPAAASSASAVAATGTGTVLLALDLGTSLRYFGTDLAPFWKGANSGSSGSPAASVASVSALDMLSVAAAHAPDVRAAAETFDAELAAEHAAKGGASFATLTSLVYRQVTGALEKARDPLTGDAWLFMKEISSDGDVSTVDVIYPASPFFLATGNSETLKRLLLPVLVYAANATHSYGKPKAYDLDWAPHHLGKWPLCNLAAEKQEQMPLEESGNLLLMVAAVVQAQGGDTDAVAWLAPYWGVLHRYAAYAQASLPDPQDQLCTDDFAGPSPHNSNLAAKGIVALAAWADVSRLNPLVDPAVAAQQAEAYAANASAFAAAWQVLALDDSGARYKLQYDEPGTWSQKYNFLFQDVLKLNPKPFPPEVVQLEEAWYASRMHKYGIPLDSRQDYTKLDWSLWVGAMGSDEQFRAIADASLAFANDCEDRVPLSDWVYTSTPQVKGFRARPVMGGIYAKLLL